MTAEKDAVFINMKLQYQPRSEYSLWVSGGLGLKHHGE